MRRAICLYPPINPKRGEVWRVDLEPARGSELQKARPCLVVSRNDMGVLPLRIIVPFTGWQDSFARHLWLVKVAAGDGGLSKDSAADLMQVQAADLSRFVGNAPLGILAPSLLQVIVDTLATIVDSYMPVE